jgi:hypothetical protein
VRRRDFIALLGVAAGGWSLSARVQQPPKVYRLGYLASQGGCLRHPDQGFSQGPLHHRGRPEAPWNAHWHNLGAPHLGFCAHPSHGHMIVPGGGLSPRRQPLDSLPTELLSPRMALSRLFRRLCLEQPLAAHKAPAPADPQPASHDRPQRGNKRQPVRLCRLRITRRSCCSFTSLTVGGNKR